MSRRRSNSLSSRRSSRNQGFKQLPVAPLSNPYASMEIISVDQVETIHRASLEILRDIGMRVESATALKMLTDLCADVDHANRRARDRIEMARIALQTDDEGLGLEAIAEVGPGGHFFGSTHTLERYQNAFYQPILSKRRNYETWQEDGARTATERANEICKRLLHEYEKPPIDPAIEEELQAYMATRKQEIANG